MKEYQDIGWLQQCLENGWTIMDVADYCNISKYTASRYFTKAVNQLSVDQAIHISTKYRDIKQLISHKTDLYKKIVNQTDYLDQDCSLKQRLWHINHGPQPPICEHCQVHHTKWDNDLQTYRKFCSTSCMSKNDTTKEKRIQTNKNRYGRDYWNQQHITQNALTYLNNKNWLYDQHKLQKKSLTKIANELDVHPLLPAQYLNKHGICGEQTSSVGKEFVDTIRLLYRGQIIENTKQIISPYELDVYLPDINIAFEFNGLYWHSELQGKGRNYHLRKTQMCNNADIRLIHIFEHQWYNSYDIVVSRLKHILHNKQNVKIINARDCHIQPITASQAHAFYDRNHIQGGINCSINFGLYYNNHLVSVMGFSRSRMSKKYEYELVRFCNQLYTVVRGGASKLFKKFINDYSPQTIVSYSDKCWNTGNLYTSLNFEFSHSSQPNYWYFKSNSFVVHSRVKFQKHKLHKHLDTFNPSLSEWENMKNNKFNRFWDCGNDVYVWSC